MMKLKVKLLLWSRYFMRSEGLQAFMEAVFPEEEACKKEGKCPFCGKKIDVNTEFKDELSKREFEISGMCQSCQDDFFD